MTRALSRTDIINNEVTGLVMFSTPTCVKCRSLKPQYDNMSEVSQSISFYSCLLDNDTESTAVIHKYNLSTVPTILYLIKGVEKARLQHDISLTELQKLINDIESGVYS